VHRSPAWQGEQIFEGIMLLSAALLLTGMIFWMRSHSSEVRLKLKDKISTTAENKGRLALFFTAFTSVLREGVELAFYLIAIRVTTSPMQTTLGALFGLTAAISIGGLLIASTNRLNLSAFFKVTNVLLLLFAAGMIARGIGELNEAGWIPSIIQQVYNTNALIPQNSMLGQFFQALFGYNSAPSLTSMVAYLLYLLGLSMTLLQKKRPNPFQVEVHQS
jgi:high-affinity iron transporter